MSVKETLKYLYDLQFFGMKLGLENTIKLLKTLNNPQHTFPSIHVAGTNGKGSTCSMMASIFQAAKLKTGLYTSPHILNFSERIRVNGSEIPESEIIHITEKMKKTIDELRCTFFEATTVMAFDYFANQQIDIGIIETGLGGRLDATNVVVPEVSVITNIGMDHTEHLGTTLDAIAGEKAGIIKEQVPCLIGPIEAELKPVFKNIADARQSPLFFYDDIVQVTSKKLTDHGSLVDLYFKVNNHGYALNELEINLAGHHQIQNAVMAVAAVRLQKKFEVSESAIREGLCSVDWKGRLQIIQHQPLIIADAAHNPMGMQKLRESIETIYRSKYDRMILVLGMLADKDFESCVNAIAGIFDTIYTVTPNSPRALSAETLAKVAKQRHAQVFVGGSVNSTVEKIKTGMTDRDLLVIAGSHFVLSEIF
ncbi:bifunctional folylpolyglutamate synthase/dihydrofolate synthase [bacterium]|nr:bifunctional folylpolyglutamate synthase/dihydrofolate synthase [bacterium]